MIALNPPMSTRQRPFCSISLGVSLSIVVFPFFEFMSCELAGAILCPLVCFQASYNGAGGRFPWNGETVFLFSRNSGNFQKMVEFFKVSMESMDDKLN
jgi:hypothetical protein